MVLHAHASLAVDIPVELDKRFMAPKGEYSMFLIYSCGKNIMNVMDEKWLIEEEKKHKAVLYQVYQIKYDQAKDKVMRAIRH